MKTNRCFQTLLLTIICAAALFAYCRKESPKKPAGPKEKVTIGAASLILSAPLIIAQEKGYFSEEGLEVTFKFYPSGKR